MRLEKMELKSDLVNLFKDLEEAKRESKEVQSPQIDQSDIKNLLSDLGKISKETKVVEETVSKEKIKEQVEIDINSLENLMKDLSSAYEQSKNEIIEEVVVTPEPEPEPIEVIDESAKIEEFAIANKPLGLVAFDVTAPAMHQPTERRARLDVPRHRAIGQAGRQHAAGGGCDRSLGGYQP